MRAAAMSTYRDGVGDSAAEVTEAGVRRAGGGGGLGRAAGATGQLHGAGWRGRDGTAAAAARSLALHKPSPLLAPTCLLSLRFGITCIPQQ